MAASELASARPAEPQSTTAREALRAAKTRGSAWESTLAVTSPISARLKPTFATNAAVPAQAGVRVSCKAYRQAARRRAAATDHNPTANPCNVAAVASTCAAANAP